MLTVIHGGKRWKAPYDKMETFLQEMSTDGIECLELNLQMMQLQQAAYGRQFQSTGLRPLFTAANDAAREMGKTLAKYNRPVTAGVIYSLNGQVDRHVVYSSN